MQANQFLQVQQCWARVSDEVETTLGPRRERVVCRRSGSAQPRRRGSKIHAFWFRVLLLRSSGRGAFRVGGILRLEDCAIPRAGFLTANNNVLGLKNLRQAALTHLIDHRRWKIAQLFN